MKIYGKLALGLLSVVAMVIANWLYTNHEVEHVHYHAGFRVYIGGQLQDYSDFKYMNFVPCTEHDTKKSAREEQIEKAHLHDSIGDVVHVHRSGAKWGDLFKNIGVTLPFDSGLWGYLDGVQQEDILNEPIEAFKTAVFVFGEDNASHAKEIVSIDHIKEVEAKSELCGAGE